MIVQNLYSPEMIVDLAIDPRLKQALILSNKDYSDLPITVSYEDQDYVIDDDEVSVHWSEEPETKSTIYIFTDRIAYTKWSASDGRDRIAFELAYSDAQPDLLQSLTSFNELIVD